MSETEKARDRLAKFCVGNGLDLGFGGDPIVPTALTIDRISHPNSNLLGDISNLYWFHDEVFDFVYASHALEDFPVTEAVLGEWLRVLRKGGLLVIFGPDEQVYKNHCETTGMAYNTDHRIDNFGLAYLKTVLCSAFYKRYEIVHEIPLVNEYSFDLVIRKVR